MKTAFIALRSVVFMTAFISFWAWVALGLRSYDARYGIYLPPWTEMPGIAFLVLGALLVLACGGVFVVQGRGTPAPFDAPREFVAVGPYQYVRNPMYVGGLASLIGFGLYERSGSILIFSAAWWGLAHLFVIFGEEPALRRTFGETYRAYCRTVPRWIPRF